MTCWIGAVGGRRALIAAALASTGLASLRCAPAVTSEEPEPAIVQQVSDGSNRVEMRLDRDAITTSEQLKLTLTVEAAEGDRVDFPTAEGDADFGEFSVSRETELPPRLTDGGRVVQAREFWLQPFLPGDYEIPGLSVEIGESGSVTTDPVTVPVASSLIEGDDQLQDIAGPLDIPVPWWWWASGGLGILALVAWLLYWRRRRRQAEGESPPLPHEEALAALDALLDSSLLPDGEVEAFYERLSAIVRRYIEGRFGLHAPERTTEEFLREISGGPLISRAHQSLLREFLQRADMVKFAQFVPGARETSGAVEAARQFIRQTVPPEPEAETGTLVT